MPTYVNILHTPPMIWVWRETVEWHWQGKTEELGEKPVPVPFCPPQIPHGLSRARSRAFAVRGRRLTTWTIARPAISLKFRNILFQATDDLAMLSCCVLTSTISWHSVTDTSTRQRTKRFFCFQREQRRNTILLPSTTAANYELFFTLLTKNGVFRENTTRVSRD
jgi:hypothetical protein